MHQPPSRPIACLLLILVASSCTKAAVREGPRPSVDELIALIEASNPSSPGYSPDTDEFTDFNNAIQALLDMGPDAAPAAPALAAALAFPRRDSYFAAWPLVGLQDLAGNSLPILIDNLHNDRAEVRRNSAYVLGTIGPTASCATEDLAALLWDPDPFVRTAASAALEGIAGNDLVDASFELRMDPATAGSVFADDPEGSVASKARDWWLADGRTVQWSPGYDACSP